MRENILDRLEEDSELEKRIKIAQIGEDPGMKELLQAHSFSTVPKEFFERHVKTFNWLSLLNGLLFLAIVCLSTVVAIGVIYFIVQNWLTILIVIVVLLLLFGR